MTAPKSPVAPVEVTAATVCSGDAITIGDRLFIVLTATPLRGGALRLRFVSGEFLTIHRATVLTALRPDPPGVRTSSFWAAHCPHRPRPVTRAEIAAQVAVGCALVVAVALAVITR